MSCPVCPKVIQNENDGSGRGLGSNGVAVTTGEPSSWSYSNYLANIGRLNITALEQRGELEEFTSRTGVRKAPVYKNMC